MLVVATRSNFMLRNHTSNSFNPIIVSVPNFPANNFRVSKRQARRSYSKEMETGYQHLFNSIIGFPQFILSFSPLGFLSQLPSYPQFVKYLF